MSRQSSGFKWAAVAGGSAVVALVLGACAGSPVTSSAANSSPSASAPSVPAVPSASLIAAQCDGVAFGSDLAPVNPPKDIHKYPAAPPMTIDQAKLYQATIATAKGNIVLCLRPGLAPVSVNNFVTLARNKFYNGLTFHRVEPGFVIQGGDPQGTGVGGPGYKFKDETVLAPYGAGAVAMANAGPNTNGSQFFIDLADLSTQLQPLYNVFGNTQSGFDVAEKIEVGDVMTSVTVRESVAPAAAVQ